MGVVEVMLFRCLECIKQLIYLEGLLLYGVKKNSAVSTALNHAYKRRSAVGDQIPGYLKHVERISYGIGRLHDELKRFGEIGMRLLICTA